MSPRDGRGGTISAFSRRNFSCRIFKNSNPHDTFRDCSVQQINSKVEFSPENMQREKNVTNCTVTGLSRIITPFLPSRRTPENSRGSFIRSNDEGVLRTTENSFSFTQLTSSRIDCCLVASFCLPILYVFLLYSLVSCRTYLVSHPTFEAIGRGTMVGLDLPE